MSERIHISTELRDTLRLAWPIVLAQAGHMSMGLVDSLVAGRIGTDALAGLGLASNVFWTFTSVCMGILLSLDTYFSQSIGAEDESSLTRYLGQSWWTCVLVTVASTACVILGTVVYQALAAPSQVSAAFTGYMWNILWCIPTLYVFFVLQRYWQAKHRVMPFLVIILGANVLNLVASLALGLGWWGAPNLGIAGIAWATNLSRYAMLLTALVFTERALRPRALHWPPVSWPVQGAIFRLGLPAAGHTALEIGAFTVATFLAGILGAAPLAAHHLSLIMAAFTFMFPLGFSAAAAVRVGTFVGAGDPARAKVAGWLCIGVSMAVMSLFAVAYFAIPRTLLRAFTADAEVVRLGTQILVLVAIFQIADGIQVSTTGALRGLGNTRTAMLANLFGHYPVGLTLGLVMCFGFGWGVVGLWCGLAAGIITVAAVLIRAWVRATQDPARWQPLARDFTVPGASPFPG